MRRSLLGGAAKSQVARLVAARLRGHRKELGFRYRDSEGRLTERLMLIHKVRKDGIVATTAEGFRNFLWHRIEAVNLTPESHLLERATYRILDGPEPKLLSESVDL